MRQVSAEKKVPKVARDMITKATLDQLVHARLNSCYTGSCMSFEVVGPSSTHAINDV